MIANLFNGLTFQRTLPLQGGFELRSRGLRTLITCLFLLAELLRAGSALAQGPRGLSEDLDLEPPLIEHDVVLEADAASHQRFVAQVADDRELAGVTLNWRFAGESSYVALAMNRVSTSSTWIGEVETALTEARSIEYFLEARDTGGNRTVRGFVFNPLVRSISNPNAPNAGPSASSNEEPPAPRRSRTLYYVLGAIALGAIAALAAGGSSGGDDDQCGPAGCDVVIVFDPPVTP